MTENASNFTERGSSAPAHDGLRASDVVREALNQAIYEEGEEGDMASGDRAYAAQQPAQAPTQPPREGLSQRDVVAALKHLQQRLAASDKRNSDAARLLSERLEGLRDRIDGVNADDLDRRLSSLETAAGKADKAFNAMRGVEGAVAQIASQVSKQIEGVRDAAADRSAATDERLDALAAQITQIERTTREATDAIEARLEDAPGSDAGDRAILERLEASTAEIGRRLGDIERRLETVENADRLFDDEPSLAADHAPRAVQDADDDEDEPAIFGRRMEDRAGGADAPQKQSIDDIFDVVDLGDDDDGEEPRPRRDKPGATRRHDEDVARAAGADKAALKSLLKRSRGDADNDLDASVSDFENEQAAAPARPGDFLAAAREAAKKRTEEAEKSSRDRSVRKPPKEKPVKEKAARRAKAPAVDELGVDDADATVALTENDEANGSKRVLAIALLLGVALVGGVGFLWTRSVLNQNDDMGVPAATIAPPPETQPATPAAQPAAPQSDTGRAAYDDAMSVLAEGADPARATLAFDRLSEAADKGHPPAQFELGKLYERGLGVPTDLVAARGWYRQAAEAGNRDAMHVLGVMYARGRGGARDQSQAVVWFQRAAELGLVNSQFNLGAIFQPSAEKGPSDLQDAEQSYFWYALAASNGDSQAMPQAARVSETLTDDARAAADARIAAWAPRPLDPTANDLQRTSDGL
ncbi:MAG: tetratricopeptide repeat protein [Pseudomonadota bacterium]